MHVINHISELMILTGLIWFLKSVIFEVRDLKAPKFRREGK